MTDDLDIARAKAIQALVSAARIERARTIRRLLQRLLRKRGESRAWRPEPAAADCR